MNRLPLLPPLLVLSMIVTVGCGTSAGTARRMAEPTAATSPAATGPTTGPTAAASSPSSQGTSPSQEPTTAVPETDVLTGRRLEARRIAHLMPLVSDVDPALALMDFPTQVITDDLTEVLTPAQIQLVQNTGGLELGFVASRRSTEGDAALVMMVLEFGTAEQAAAVAAALPTADPDKEPLTSAVPTAVAGRLLAGDVAEVEVAVVDGTLLHYSRAITWKDDDGLPLGEKAVQSLQQALAGFRVTPPASRVDLPADLDSLVAHTLPESNGSPAALVTGHAALHVQYHQVAAATVFANAGVDLAAVGDVSVYRTAGSSGAALLQAHFLSESAVDGDQRDTEIDGLPGSTRCTSADTGGVTCAGTVGRYVFKFHRADPAEAVEVSLRQQNLLEQL